MYQGRAEEGVCVKAARGGARVLEELMGMTIGVLLL